MGIDAVALLRIRKLAAPRPSFGTEVLVMHRGDASLVHTFNRFDGMAPDEHALALRQLLGPAVDAHDDPRGILFFPDVCEPSGRSYQKLVTQIGTGGVWAPKVEADQVPARYQAASPDSHEALVARIIAAMGRDAATQLDLLAQVHLLVIVTTEGRPDAVSDYQAAITQLTLAMGADFAQTYERSLRSKVDTDRAAQQAHYEQTQQMWARAQSGQPLVSEQELGDFLNSDTAADLLQDLSPDLREALKPLGKKS